MTDATRAEAPTKSDTPLGASRASRYPATRKRPSLSATRPTRSSPATRTKGYDQTCAAEDRGRVGVEDGGHQESGGAHDTRREAVLERGAEPPVPLVGDVRGAAAGEPGAVTGPDHA